METPSRRGRLRSSTTKSKSNSPAMARACSPSAETSTRFLARNEAGTSDSAPTKRSRLPKRERGAETETALARVPDNPGRSKIARLVLSGMGEQHGGSTEPRLGFCVVRTRILLGLRRGFCVRASIVNRDPEDDNSKHVTAWSAGSGEPCRYAGGFGPLPLRSY